MGVYSTNLSEEVRLERMHPAQIERARQRRAAIYVPFGALEWHGYHNPVGLDALKAHEQLVGLAAAAGGVVYPPVYFGAGGGHTQWSHSYMVDAGAMAQIVSELLHGFERDGYSHAILISGHYPNRKEYLDAGVSRYRQAGGGMKVLALVENEAPGVSGDHAAKYETSAMLFLDPALVNTAELERQPAGRIGGPEERINWMTDEYKGHPCYGLVGIDPRPHASAAVGQAASEALIEFLRQWLDEAEAPAGG